MLADLQGLQGHLSMLLQLLVTPVLFLLWHVKMSAVRETYYQRALLPTTDRMSVEKFSDN